MKTNIIISLITLDKNSVINENSYEYIKSPSDFKTITVNIEAMKMPIIEGIPLAITTNHSGIGPGFFNYAIVCRIYQKLVNLLGDHSDSISYITMCPNLPDQNHNYKKPKTGLLYKILIKLMIPFNRTVYFIRDNIKDIETAKIPGCITVLVKTGTIDLTIIKQYFLQYQVLVLKHPKQFMTSIV